MSFTSQEIIGKIWEYWPTFLLTCKCSYVQLTVRDRETVAVFGPFYNRSFNDTWLTAQSRLCSNFASQHKQTLWAITSMKSLDLKTHPHFHSFWQQAETLIQCYLALPRNYTAHPVAFTIHVIRLRSLLFFQPISDRLYLCPPCRG